MTDISTSLAEFIVRVAWRGGWGGGGLRYQPTVPFNTSFSMTVFSIADRRFLVVGRMYLNHSYIRIDSPQNSS